jgi:hypothetical protein
VWRIVFVVVGIGFAAGAASWFAAGRRSRGRARFLERDAEEVLQGRYWRAVMAKDNLIGALFFTVAIAIAGVAAERDVRAADYLLLACAVPLVLSLAWVERFRWAAGVSEATAERVQQLREQQTQDVDIGNRLAAWLGTTDRRVQAGFVVETLYYPVEGVVGGDFIGSVPLGDGCLAIVVGDVIGHGLDAGLDAMRLKDLLFADLTRNRSPMAALSAANAHLLRREDVLATAFIGIVTTHTVRYASAGHLPGIIVEASAHRLLPSTGILLGAEQELDVRERTVDLDGDAAVVVYTDGLTEAHGPRGGLDAPDIAAIVRAGDFARLRDVVHERVPLPLRDDIAALLIRTGTPAVDH